MESVDLIKTGHSLRGGGPIAGEPWAQSGQFLQLDRTVVRQIVTPKRSGGALSIAVILPGWGDEPRNGRSMEPPSQKRGSSKARTGDSLGTYQELIIREVEELVLRTE